MNAQSLEKSFSILKSIVDGSGSRRINLADRYGITKMLLFFPFVFTSLPRRSMEMISSVIVSGNMFKSVLYLLARNQYRTQFKELSTGNVWLVIDSA